MLNNMALSKCDLIYAPIAIFLPTILILSVAPNLVISAQTSDYTLLRIWGTKGSENGQFNIPHSLAFDRFGNAYVSDTNNQRIQKFTADGKFITKWGSEGSSDGQFNQPHSSVVDSDRKSVV